ncbi:hypothetical protein Q8A67_008627 [Cirrhinus molitorella]|uniref:Immunoglobulin V-set domain-containing protein n=1 Tax=Cirrhinus molitorella TaxID=172907 RepID=A0AA88PUT6_9TELE|nr:hypothetical protein Q8A67_008627 [Cirrhinus molitorella]
MSVNQLLVLLLHLTFKTGFTAEISVFVKMGASVQLDIQTQLQKIDFILWEKDNSTQIVTYISSKKKSNFDSTYKNRVYFNPETFSMTLNNMENTDNGLYTALANYETYVAAYNVSVYDEVKAPVLTVNSNQSSSDSCIVNFTCRSHHFTLNSTYNRGSCSQKEVISDGINTLILSCSEKSIICKLSNPVSSKEDKKYIKELCVNKDQNPEESSSSSTPWWPVGVGVAAIVLILTGLVILYCKHKKGAQKEVEGTVYAQAEGQEMQKLNRDCHTYDTPDRVQDQKQKKTADERPETTYCTVGQHQKPCIPPETDHTIYSAVFKQSNKKPPTI